MSVRGEFSAGWRVIAASVIGIAVGIMALPFSTAGFFIPHLEQEFGWSRTQISFASTILIFMVAISSPIVGWFADRKSQTIPIAFSLTAVACGFFALSQVGGSLKNYYAVFALMAFLGSGASSLVFARLVSSAFVQARGLALGIAMTGNAFTTMIAPGLLVPFLAQHGWRSGYQVLALVVALAVVIILLLLRGQTAAQRPLASSRSTIENDTSVFRASIASRPFWLMAVAFLAVPLAATGLLLHFVPLLTDAGLSPAHAGVFAGLIGVGLLFGRIFTGYLMDRFDAGLVGATMMMLSAAGFAMFVVIGVEAAPFAALSIGLSIGAEIDLIGFLTARYFGMSAYGRTYGVLYASCLVGTGLSPMLYGIVIDQTGSYSGAIMTGALLLIFSAILLVVLSLSLSHLRTQEAVRAG